MSGAGPPFGDTEAVAIPAADDTSGDWRATMTSTAARSPASATPAMIHGVRSDLVVAVECAAALPQEEQKRDPRESGAPQLGHCTAVPQPEQNFPEVGSPQAGHADGEAVMAHFVRFLKVGVSTNLAGSGRKKISTRKFVFRGHHEDFVKTVTSIRESPEPLA